MSEVVSRTVRFSCGCLGEFTKSTVPDIGHRSVCLKCRREVFCEFAYYNLRKEGDRLWCGVEELWVEGRQSAVLKCTEPKRHLGLHFDAPLGRKFEAVSSRKLVSNRLTTPGIRP